MSAVVVQHHDQLLLTTLRFNTSLEVGEIVEETFPVGAPVHLEVSMVYECA